MEQLRKQKPWVWTAQREAAQWHLPFIRQLTWQCNDNFHFSIGGQAERKFWGKNRPLEFANVPMTGGILQKPSVEMPQMGFTLSSIADSCETVY